MTLIPDLERDLTEAADRLRRPGGRAERTRRLGAAATGVAAAAAALALLLSGGGDEQRHPPATSAPLPPATLDGLLSVFRREPTARDSTGTSIAELDATGDRQPGEDPTRSRRINLPVGPVFLWPMRGGVCSSWGNCLPLTVLRRLGVAVGTESGGGPGSHARAAVSGIVVDGIDEVVLVRAEGGPLVVPVTDNVFRVEFRGGEALPVEIVWRYRGRERRQPLALATTGVPEIDELLRREGPQAGFGGATRPLQVPTGDGVAKAVAYASIDGRICHAIAGWHPRIEGEVRGSFGGCVDADELAADLARDGAVQSGSLVGPERRVFTGHVHGEVTSIRVPGVRAFDVQLSPPWRPLVQRAEPLRHFVLVDETDIDVGGDGWQQDEIDLVPSSPPALQLRFADGRTQLFRGP